ncbi:Glycine--tRNA ligase [Bienertia sinuspersici]
MSNILLRFGAIRHTNRTKPYHAQLFANTPYASKAPKIKIVKPLPLPQQTPLSFALSQLSTMVKGEDVKLRKKNKAIRKKLAKDPSSVSARVAGIIAAKKRRHAGKRRNCQGMCFSLPTPEDPFNERHGKEDISASKSKWLSPQSSNKASRLKQSQLENRENISTDNSRKEKYMKLGSNVKDGYLCTLKNFGYPSKFLWSCLNSVWDSLPADDLLDKEQDRPSFVDSWGVEFWKAYWSGNDILENSGTSPSVLQMIWIACTAADSMSQKEKEGRSFTSPFLLYLVSSQTKANKVRSVSSL